MSTARATDHADVPAIELREVVKDFAIGLRGVKLRALSGVSLRVMPGQVFGLLGPNGSGKSTLIKLVLGLHQPTSGSCAVFGLPSASRRAREAVGYLPEAPDFYRHLTGRELVRFYGRMCGMSGAALEERIANALGDVGLSAAADRRVGSYSKGMLQRIGLAQALVHAPRLLILDEPTAGLDPMGVAAISELILRQKAEGRTVVMTSHLLAHMEEICDRIGILDRGRLVLEGDVREVLGGGERQQLSVDALSAEHLRELRRWFESRGIRLHAIEPARNRLDKLFVERMREGESS